MCTVSSWCGHHVRIKREGRIAASLIMIKVQINEHKWCMDESPAQAMEKFLLQLVLHGIELIIETAFECVAVCVCVLAVM